jgi:hypothetical protein
MVGARPAWDRFFAVFPTASKHWKYVIEQASGSHHNPYSLTP